MMDVIITKTTITCSVSLKEPEIFPTLTKPFQLPDLIISPCFLPQQLSAQAERGVWDRAEVCKGRAEKNLLFDKWSLLEK